MINERSYSEAVAEELSLTQSAYAEDVAGEAELTSSAYGEDVAEAINEGVEPTPTPTYDLRVMQFNIGHFNMGMADGNSALIGTNTSYAAQFPQFFNYATQLQRWSAYIDSVNADIIGMPEYNENFGYNGSLVTTAYSGIFNGYHLSVGKKALSGWWQNTLASKFQLTDVGNDLGDIDLVNMGNRSYVRVATAVIKEKTVKIAVTHLDFNRNSQVNHDSRIANIALLVEMFENEPYLILLGDFNTQGPYGGTDYSKGLEEYQPFIDAGFTIANSEANPLLTCEATGSRPDAGHLNYPYTYLDNIIVKGFTMSNVRVLDTGVQVDGGTVDVGMLSDHCAVVCDLTMIEEGGES